MIFNSESLLFKRIYRESNKMGLLRTVIIILALIALCQAQHVKKYKKKHHHHGLHHLHFLSYLTFLAVKLKIVFFLGTIFTISLVAAKIIGIIKLTEYMKQQHPHHEEKIVYSNPYEHHHDFGGYPGPSDYISSKAYGSYPPDFSADHPPVDYHDTEPYGGGPAPSSGRSSTGFYGEFMGIAKRLRQMNITDMAFKEMGIPEEECRRKFVCKADLNAAKDVVLRIGFDILRDDSYGKYKAQAPVRSEDDCNSLYPKCAT